MHELGPLTIVPGGGDYLLAGFIAFAVIYVLMRVLTHRLGHKGEGGDDGRDHE